MSSLMTLDTLKAILGVRPTNTAKDTQYTALLDAASAYLEQYCGRKFAKTTYTEYYSGNGQRALVLRQRPVWSITSVHVDHQGYFGTSPSPFGTSTLLTAGTDYSLEQDLATVSGQPISRSGLLIRIGTIWAEMGRQYFPGKLATEIGPAFGNIKVVYVAGYETLPYDLQVALSMLVSLFQNTVVSGQPLMRERIGDYSYEILSGRYSETTHPVFGSLDKILNRYKEVAF